MRKLPAIALAVIAVLAPSTALAATHHSAAAKPSAKKTVVVPPLRTVPVGISEQNATMFSDPLFAPLGVKYARYVTPWNAASSPGTYAAQQLDKWIVAARAAGVSPLVSFEHMGNEDCPRDPCVLPSTTAYRAAFRAFHTLYPDVTAISPWNEANHPSQPTYKKPAVAAQYYEIVKSECPACQVVAADVLDMTNMEKWLTAFVKAAPEARLWGMHNYGDANRFRTSGLATYLKVTKGSVWLTETGAITSFTTTAGVVSFKKSDSRLHLQLGQRPDQPLGLRADRQLRQGAQGLRDRQGLQRDVDARGDRHDRQGLTAAQAGRYAARPHDRDCGWLDCV
jgi:hypothetical protein